MLEVSAAADVLRAAAERVRRDYGDAIGRGRTELVTPALVLDIDLARRNITTMADRLRKMPSELRPHIKVHKSPELARLQVQAGAIGVSVATVWEATAMVAAGFDSVFVVNTVVGREKLAALAALAGQADVMVAVDDAGNAKAVAAAASGAGTTVGVLIEVDTGMDRAGVDSVEEALVLGDHVAALGGLELRGVTGYEGHCALTPERELRHERQRAAMSFLVEVADALRERGLPCPIVSAGGTATWDWTAADPRLTEIQAGSYVVMDNFHGAMIDGFQYALTVATTVISRRPDRVIVDAGNKSMGAPDLATIRGHDLRSLRFDEEHGLFVARPDTELAVGDVVELIPGYAPATVNWYDAYHVVSGDEVVDVWPVVSRGPGHGGLLG
jgi:D-serine deaminase-like pyridoxal phosphate-dependent protein